jgi:hypothetical protein
MINNQDPLFSGHKRFADMIQSHTMPDCFQSRMAVDLVKNRVEDIMAQPSLSKVNLKKMALIRVNDMWHTWFTGPTSREVAQLLVIKEMVAHVLLKQNISTMHAVAKRNPSGTGLHEFVVDPSNTFNYLDSTNYLIVRLNQCNPPNPLTMVKVSSSVIKCYRCEIRLTKWRSYMYI